MTSTYYFLSWAEGNFQELPCTIAYDIFNWMKFLISLIICFTSKLLIYFLREVLFAYHLFLEMLEKPPESAFHSRPPPRRFRRLKYAPLEAYNKHHINLSCYQLSSMCSASTTFFFQRLYSTMAPIQMRLSQLLLKI